MPPYRPAASLSFSLPRFLYGAFHPLFPNLWVSPVLVSSNVFISLLVLFTVLCVTMNAAKESAELLYEQAHVDETHVPQLIAAFTVSLVIAYGAVALRLISRRLSRTQLKWDDWTILLSLVKNLSRAVISTYNVHLH